MKNFNEIRNSFLAFFKEKGHKIIPSASLIPENDPSVLFNTAGMQPLVPYLLGSEHPLGTRLANSQKCLRTNDIEEVGDKTHFTFFEMLGNWSLGDYFKKESLNWSWEFLIDSEKGLGLDPKRIYVTVFAGDDRAEKDEESYLIWKEIFNKAGLKEEGRIFYMEGDSNWWSAGENGPCGPDSEIFYDLTEEGLGEIDKEKFIKADEDQKLVEIWNNVFMEYLMKDGKVIGKLERKNVDTGMGLERITSIVQKKESPYETDIFLDLIDFIESKSEKKYPDNKKDYRVFLDHLRSSVFLISEKLEPSNKDQGYVLRRLIRRMYGKMDILNLNIDDLNFLIDLLVKKYQYYSDLKNNSDLIKNILNKEIEKFSLTLKKAYRELDKIIKKDNFNKILSGEEAFKLVTTFGLPFEFLEERAMRDGFEIDKKKYFEKMEEHNKKSATSSAGKFKGGLADTDPKTIAFHTATHLLLAGLRKYLGNEVNQRGSNITSERVRFDFSYEQKVDPDILKKIEDYVNEVIDLGVDMKVVEMKKEDAMNSDVVGSFWDKYPEVVKVWVLEKDGEIYSKELCGGPHVSNTSEIKKFGKFKIKKESSSSAGVRRIKAVFE